MALPAVSAILPWTSSMATLPPTFSRLTRCFLHRLRMMTVSRESSLRRSSCVHVSRKTLRSKSFCDSATKSLVLLHLLKLTLDASTSLYEMLRREGREEGQLESRREAVEEEADALVGLARCKFEGASVSEEIEREAGGRVRGRDAPASSTDSTCMAV